MIKILKFSMIMALVFNLGTVSIYAQTKAAPNCQTWNDLSNKDQIEEAHVLYRQHFKAQDFEKAFPYWEKAYKAAPAADGQRPFHFMDGRDLYKDLLTKTTDEAKKKEYKEAIMRLYDEEIACYKNEAYLLGRKGFDMFYTLNSLYSENLAVLEKAIEVGGNNIEYIVLDPAARIAVYQYKNELLTKEQVRDLNIKLNEIADYNVENNTEYGEQYQVAKDAMNGIYAEIEDDIFDCEYFKTKLVPKYQENPDDLEVIKYVYNKLNKQGCDPSEAIMVELKGKYETLAAGINAELEKTKRMENPGYDANELYKEGNYAQAIARYKDAIELETDMTKKGEYYNSIAVILYRKQDNHSEARRYARKAIEVRPDWGRPYMLIGDMYGATSRSCGDAWKQRLVVLAAIDKYAKAKSVDPSVADDANERIGKYSSSRPLRQEGFMRGVKEGQSANTGCWIGETVRISFSD